jgi:hypothetical protein
MDWDAGNASGPSEWAFGEGQGSGRFAGVEVEQVERDISRTRLSSRTRILMHRLTERYSREAILVRRKNRRWLTRAVGKDCFWNG